MKNRRRSQASKGIEKLELMACDASMLVGRGQQDGSVGESACHQVWGPEFNPRAHMVEGEN